MLGTASTRKAGGTVAVAVVTDVGTTAVAVAVDRSGGVVVAGAEVSGSLCSIASVVPLLGFVLAVDAVVLASAAAAVSARGPAKPIGELSRRPPEGTTSADAFRRARLTGFSEGTPELSFATWPDALSGRRGRPGSVDDVAAAVAFESDDVESDDVEPDRGDALEDGDS